MEKSEKSGTEPKVTQFVRSLPGSVEGWAPNTTGTGQVDSTHKCESLEALVSVPLTYSFGNPKGVRQSHPGLEKIKCYMEVIGIRTS